MAAVFGGGLVTGIGHYWRPFGSPLAPGRRGWRATVTTTLGLRCSYCYEVWLPSWPLPRVNCAHLNAKV